MSNCRKKSLYDLKCSVSFDGKKFYPCGVSYRYWRYCYEKPTVAYNIENFDQAKEAISIGAIVDGEIISKPFKEDCIDIEVFCPDRKKKTFTRKNFKPFVIKWEAIPIGYYTMRDLTFFLTVEDFYNFSKDYMEE